MADFWIKVEKSTPDKPEIFEIANELDLCPDSVLGKLIRVWVWMDSNSESGHIKSVTAFLIDRVSGHKGFAEAMKKYGWLNDDYIPNFDRHMGESAKKRAKDSERKRKSRNVTDLSAERPQNVRKVSDNFVTESGLDKIRVDKSKDIVVVPTPKRASKVFIKPELTDLAGYFQEIGSTTCNDDAKDFLDYYTSNGWKVGKNSMKDWRATVRRWLKSKNERATSKPNNQYLTANEKAGLRAAATEKFESLEDLEF